jgi:hypothetical protein
MSKNHPIKYPVVEIKIPQDVNYSGHVRRQTPDSLDAERKKGIYRTPYGSRAKWAAIFSASNCRSRD